MAIRFVRAQGGTAEAGIIATGIKTSAVNAALVNGMFGHADETDDFEPVTKAQSSITAPCLMSIARTSSQWPW
ncbi:MAG: MmgE/PrpD family protein [Thermodesulfobacteriota bacterium]